jgi:intracellular multiplication protein IcmW
MPDLSHEATCQFWKDYEDPMIYRVISFMEGVENWTLDGDTSLETAITQLGTELDDISKIDMGELAHEEAFIRLACNIKSGRALRLLQAIDVVHPGSASRLLIHAEENSESNEDPAGIFLRRNIVFERLRLLGRVFSEERFQLVLKALEGEE